MHRFRAAVITAFLAGILVGCDEGQPNTPAKPDEVNADFAAKAAADMKNANTGMDPKALKKGAGK